MTKVSSAFPSQYLKAADLQGKAVRVTIDRIEMEEVGREKDAKPVLYFAGKGKGMVLNKTNANKIAGTYGDEMDDWTGQEVELYEAMVDFQGDTVEAIRIRIPKGPAPQRQPAPARRVSEAEPPPPDDDEIPF